MTASLPRSGKGKAGAGLCLFAYPRRQPRRVSNLVPHAGGDSNPRSSSGPADSSYIFAPQGHPIHPGLVSLPGSQSVFVLGAAVAGAALNNRVTSAEFGDHARDGLVKRLPCVGSLHSQRMEQPDGKVRVEGSAKISGG